MGIKNIHLLLIIASVLLSLLFGIWGLSHQYVLLGCCSLVLMSVLIVYGIQFFKKMKVL